MQKRALIVPIRSRSIHELFSTLVPNLYDLLGHDEINTYKNKGMSRYAYNPVSDKIIIVGNIRDHALSHLDKKIEDIKRNSVEAFSDVWDDMSNTEKAIANAIAASHEVYERLYCPLKEDGTVDKYKSFVGWPGTTHHDMRVVLDESNLVSELPDSLWKVKLAYKLYRSPEEILIKKEIPNFEYGKKLEKTAGSTSNSKLDPYAAASAPFISMGIPSLAETVLNQILHQNEYFNPHNKENIKKMDEIKSTYSKILSDMKDKDFLKNKKPNLHFGESVAFGYERGTKNPVVLVNPKNKNVLQTLTHELGHASKPKSKISNIMRRLQPTSAALRRFGLIPGLAVDTIGRIGKENDERTVTQQLAPLAAAVPNIPEIYEEGRAWVKGKQLASKIGKGSKYYRKGLRPFSTYLVPAAASMAATYLLSKSIDKTLKDKKR